METVKGEVDRAKVPRSGSKYVSKSRSQRRSHFSVYYCREKPVGGGGWLRYGARESVCNRDYVDGTLPSTGRIKGPLSRPVSLTPLDWILVCRSSTSSPCGRDPKRAGLSPGPVPKSSYRRVVSVDPSKFLGPRTVWGIVTVPIHYLRSLLSRSSLPL